MRRLELAREHEAGRVDARELEPWEAARAELDALGSFRELRVALEELCGADPFGWTCVRLVYGYEAELRVCGPSIRAAAEEGVAFLALRLPDPIRVPGPSEPEVLRSLRSARGWRGERARVVQDREMRELAAGGVSQVEIGRRFGLGQPAVSKILRRVNGSEEAA